MWAWDLDCWVILNMGNPCVFRKGEIEIYSPACPSGVFDRHKSVSGMKFQTSCIQINYSLQLEKDSHFFMENFRHSSIFQIITSSSCDFSSKRQPRKKKPVDVHFYQPQKYLSHITMTFPSKKSMTTQRLESCTTSKGGKALLPPSQDEASPRSEKTWEKPLRNSLNSLVVWWRDPYQRFMIIPTSTG